MFWQCFLVCGICMVDKCFVMLDKVVIVDNAKTTWKIRRINRQVIGLYCVIHCSYRHLIFSFLCHPLVGTLYVIIYIIYKSTREIYKSWCRENKTKINKQEKNMDGSASNRTHAPWLLYCRSSICIYTYTCQDVFVLLSLDTLNKAGLPFS